MNQILFVSSTEQPNHRPLSCDALPSLPFATALPNHWMLGEPLISFACWHCDSAGFSTSTPRNPERSIWFQNASLPPHAAYQLLRAL